MKSVILQCQLFQGTDSTALPAGFTYSMVVCVEEGGEGGGACFVHKEAKEK